MSGDENTAYIRDAGGQLKRIGGHAEDRFQANKLALCHNRMLRLGGYHGVPGRSFREGLPELLLRQSTNRTFLTGCGYYFIISASSGCIPSAQILYPLLVR